MRPRYLVVIVAAVALAFLAAPAQAAMPTSKPTETKVCPNNPKKKLRLWATKTVFAVDNPCSDWFVMDYNSVGSSDSSRRGVNVAGYSKVNLPIPNLMNRDWGWRLSPTAPFCSQRESGTLAYYGDGHKLNLSGSGLLCDDGEPF
jgi:hypothetical protein